MQHPKETIVLRNLNWDHPNPYCRGGRRSSIFTVTFKFLNQKKIGKTILYIQISGTDLFFTTRFESTFQRFLLSQSAQAHKKNLSYTCEKKSFKYLMHPVELKKTIILNDFNIKETCIIFLGA